MKLYFVAGEASADNHGAELLAAIHALCPEAEFHGRGGPRMREIAGPHFNDWLDSAAVLGIAEVLRKYGYFREQFAQVLSEIDLLRPDAIVLIDYPGFNLRLATALRAAATSSKIIYYISPQVWAWNRRRVRKMRRHIDLMLCIFPFETAFYEKSGLRAKFVGHPMLQSLAAKRVATERDRDLVALLPGSREREIAKILPIMLRAARFIRERRPATRFAIAAASEDLGADIRKVLEREEFPEEICQISPGDTAVLLQRAQIGLIASGTATLEAAYFRLPFVLVYKVARLTYLAAKILVRLKYIGMPNVLAGREIVPEFIQGKADPALVAENALTLLHSEQARAQMVAEFDTVMGSLGEAEASGEAAAAILQELRC